MITYKVEQNLKYGDFRIVMYIDGVWENQFDNNWSKYKATKILNSYKKNHK